MADALKNKVPFVLFRPPDDSYLRCLSDSDTIVKDATAAFIFAPFDRDRSPLYFTKPIGFKVETSALPAPIPFPAVELDRTEGEKAAYTGLVQRIQDAIESSDLRKVVISRAIQLPVSRDAWTVFLHMMSQYAHACCYWWYHPESGHWMGATPEVLISALDHKVEIMSLAGTLADGSAETDWTDKEREEQAVVTSYIEDILNTHGEHVTKEGPVTIKAGKLLHLKTQLKAHVKGDLNAVLERLHPTPAVCGFPTQHASQMIRALEPYDREYYTGYFGVLSKDPAVPTQLYVNLRCMKWSDSGITIYVGGGITEGSDAESEWQETIDKSRTLMDILDITRV